MDAASDHRDPDPSGPADRLDSWKEIAAYLRRSARTVQRWERLEGLPVHRLVHDKLGSVYAYRTELDAWWAERRSRLETEADEGQVEAAVTSTPGGVPSASVETIPAGSAASAPAAPRTRRWAGAAIGIGLAADAHLAYLQGRYAWNKRTEPDFWRAIGFFEQAMAIDPSYAPAYSGLADAYLLLSNYGHMPVEQALPKAKAAANRALVLDDTLAEGHASLAFAVEVYDRDLRVAAQQFERALALNPNYATARLWYGLLLLNLGRFEEARAQLLTGLQADPFSPAIHGNIAMCDFLAGRYDAAIEQLRDELALHPDRALTEIDLGRVYIQKGDYQNGLAALRHARTLAGGDLMFEAVLAYGLARAGERAEAEAIFDRLVRASDTRRVPPYYLAVVSAGLGRNDEAFRWLEQVLSERHISALSLNVEPELSSLRSDPRFPDLRRRAGLE